MLIEKIKKTYELKCEHEDPAALQQMERYIMLNAIDKLWQEHLYGMDALREAVYLRAYGQKDPLVEFKNEAYEMFTELMGNIKNEILHNLFRSTSNLLAFEQFLSSLPQMLIAPDELGGSSQTVVAPRESERSEGPGITIPEPEPSLDAALTARVAAAKDPSKVGRNDPCPCGSGRKFKSCCGKNA